MHYCTAPPSSASFEQTSLIHSNTVFVGPLQRVRPRNGILGLVLVVLVVLVVPLRSEFIGEL